MLAAGAEAEPRPPTVLSQPLSRAFVFPLWSEGWLQGSTSAQPAFVPFHRCSSYLTCLEDMWDGAWVGHRSVSQGGNVAHPSSQGMFLFYIFGFQKEPSGEAWGLGSTSMGSFQCFWKHTSLDVTAKSVSGTLAGPPPSVEKIHLLPLTGPCVLSGFLERDVVFTSQEAVFPEPPLPPLPPGNFRSGTVS